MITPRAKHWDHQLRLWPRNPRSRPAHLAALSAVPAVAALPVAVVLAEFVEVAVAVSAAAELMQLDQDVPWGPRPRCRPGHIRCSRGSELQAAAAAAAAAGVVAAVAVSDSAPTAVKPN